MLGSGQSTRTITYRTVLALQRRAGTRFKRPFTIPHDMACPAYVAAARRKPLPTQSRNMYGLRVRSVRPLSPSNPGGPLLQRDSVASEIESAAHLSGIRRASVASATSITT